MKYRLMVLLISLLIVLLDQVSKYYVQNLLLVDRLPIFDNGNLVSVWNHGVSFGIGNNLPVANLLFIIIAVALSVVLLVTIWKAKNIIIMIGAAVTLGGAIGNIIDRARFGAVYDFIDIHVRNFHWPAFNIADAMIFIGIVILFAGDMHVKYKAKNN